MRKIFLSLLLALGGLSAWAQDFGAIWGEVERNNPTLAALRAGADAEKLAARTGLAPSDPEVEFHYLWGGDNARRVDLSIKQSFDFPSVYAFKSKVAKMEGERIETQYRVGRMELIVAVGQLYSNIVYYNAMVDAYQKRVSDMRTLADGYATRLASGDVNKIEYNRAQLAYKTLAVELDQMTSERNVLLGELAGFNGGRKIDVVATNYGADSLTSFNGWMEVAMERNPTIQAAMAQVDVDKNKLRVARAQWLPKISVGYMSERVVTSEHFQGVTAGISLPLWENSRSVNAAKANILANQGKLADLQNQVQTRLQALYSRASNLKKTANDYIAVVSADNSMELLRKALESGEITLFEYVTEGQLYYNNQDKAMQALRDFQNCYVELNAFTL